MLSFIFNFFYQLGIQKTQKHNTILSFFNSNYLIETYAFSPFRVLRRYFLFSKSCNYISVKTRLRYMTTKFLKISFISTKTPIKLRTFPMWSVGSVPCSVWSLMFDQTIHHTARHFRILKTFTSLNAIDHFVALQMRLGLLNAPWSLLSTTISRLSWTSACFCSWFQFSY